MEPIIKRNKENIGYILKKAVLQPLFNLYIFIIRELCYNQKLDYNITKVKFIGSVKVWSYLFQI